MMIAARNAFLISGAKPYDAEVEYLESTGTQYIDSGVTTSSNVDVDIDCSDVISNTWIFGGRIGYKNQAIGFYRIPNGYIRCCYGGQEWDNPYGTYRHILSLIAGGFYIDGGLVHQFGAETFANVSPIYICNLSSTLDGAPSTIGMVGRIYGATLSKNSILVRDFIPVRVGSGASAVGYLYDRANPDGGPLGNGLYPNAGTGAFVVGPDK